MSSFKKTYTYYERKLLEEIKEYYDVTLRGLIDTKVIDLKIEGFTTKEPTPFNDRLNYPLKEYKINDSWGSKFDCGWFKLTGKIKEPKEKYFLKVDLGSETLLYDEFGVPLKGFTYIPISYKKKEEVPSKLYYPVNDLLKNDNLELWVEAGANDTYGYLLNAATIRHAEIVTRNYEIRKLMYDIENIYLTVITLDRKHPRHKRLFSGLKEIYYLYIYEDKDWLEKSFVIVDSLNLATKDKRFSIYSLGHAHIDIAWLWPVRETKRKLVRKIANVIYLIENHDRFIFGISQPQLLYWLKQESKELFEKFKHYVKVGRIELLGAMWVEADTNLPGEESLVRQLLYGIKFYEEEFDFRVRNLWLPDSFGFNGNMPQLMNKAGLNYFLTIKLTWNLSNEFPHNTFIWKGIDGSEVISHIPPLATYNSNALPREHLKLANNYKEIKDIPLALNLYGIGSGGVGVGFEYVERIDRQRNFDPIPYLSYRKAERYFEHVEQYRRKMSVYEGELYLENHQGVYTSQSNSKYYNNLIEQMLKSIETFLVSSNHISKHQEELDEIWKEVLSYQSHNIITGTSIKRVYDELYENYQNIIKRLEEMIKPYSSKDTLFNPLLKEVDFIRKEQDKYYSYNINPLSFSKRNDEFNVVKESKELFFETKNLKVTFNEETGVITSIQFDNKEILRTPNFNQLLVYKDLGDALDILKHYRKQTPKQMSLINRVVKHYGRITEVVQEYEFKNSKLVETIVIDEERNALEFNHKVNWQDLGYMLRTSFPVDINSDDATYDIQFGNIKRKRNRKDPIEEAKFEVPAQHWVNIKNSKCSFSLINNTKHGLYTDDKLIDLNLLRSTNKPSVNGDIGETSYKYLTVFHKDDYDIDEIDHQATIFNTYFPKLNPVTNQRLFTLDNFDITYSTIKQSYDKKGIIIRLYEKSGYTQETTLKLNFPYEKLELVNLVEEYQNVLANLNLKFKPFEIKTIKIYPK